MDDYDLNDIKLSEANYFICLLCLLKKIENKISFYC
jgi:hypothetical protein